MYGDFPSFMYVCHECAVHRGAKRGHWIHWNWIHVDAHNGSQVLCKRSEPLSHLCGLTLCYNESFIKIKRHDTYFPLVPGDENKGPCYCCPVEKPKQKEASRASGPQQLCCQHPVVAANTWDKQLKTRKDSDGMVVLKFPFMVLLTSLLWVWNGHSRGSPWQNRSVYLQVASKQRTTGRSWSPSVPFKGATLANSNVLPLGPTS